MISFATQLTHQPVFMLIPNLKIIFWLVLRSGGPLHPWGRLLLEELRNYLTVEVPMVFLQTKLGQYLWCFKKWFWKGVLVMCSNRCDMRRRPSVFLWSFSSFIHKSRETSRDRDRSHENIREPFKLLYF